MMPMRGVILKGCDRWGIEQGKQVVVWRVGNIKVWLLTGLIVILLQEKELD
jgi:hypothetical protein